jgi:hypothetical protein
MALITVTGIWAQQVPPPSHGYVSQLASGGGWKTTLTLFNPTSGQVEVSVLFRADDGSPLSLPLVVTQGGAQLTRTSSEVGRTIQPLATLRIESEAPAGSSVLTGWADVISRTPIAGSAIFSQQGQDGRSVEAVVPLDYSTLTSVVAPFDNRAGAATGVALVNPTDSPVNLIVRSRNENGIELDQSRLLLPPRGHTAFVIAERFPSIAGLQGTIEFLNPAAPQLTGLGLRFNTTGGFTSIPVLHLSEPLATQP